MWAAALAAMFAGTTVFAQVVDTIVPNIYHAQVYNNWCGSASIEMMLDCPAVAGGNAKLPGWLASGDGPAVAAGGARPAPAIDGNGNITANMQAFIYGLNHGVNTINGVWYFNPFVPYGVGTDSAGVVADLQLLDNPNVNGQTGPAFGSHVYTGYNAAPTLLGAAAATRTIANCLADYNVPAQIVVQNGAHSIIVDGVETVGKPGVLVTAQNPTPNPNYTIKYVQVSDPWTGYAFQRLAVGDVASTGGAMGLGFNTWLRYGYDQLSNGQGIAIVLPNGTVVPNARLGAWFNYFNVSPGQASAGFTTPGYKFTVEPQGPEGLDDGNSAFDGSLPPPPALLPSQETAADAYSAALADLAADSQLSGEPGLHGGSLDTNPAHEMLLQMPGDTAGMGDWLVPYEIGGGSNNVTGAMLIDSETGVIDQATWIDPAHDGIGSISLSQLDQIFMDEAQGILPNDNAVPEPSALALLAAGGAAIGFRAAGNRARRRR